MSSTDNAMARFLFAILQQKNLKDIDWNKVAHDPLLVQEISNGHAARMRYFRFRAAMLGLEPQRRNRTSANKSRVSKKRKDGKSRRDEGSLKADSCGEESIHIPANTGPSTSAIKAGRFRATPDSHGSPTFAVTASETQGRLATRLLTPCSDSDILAHAPGFAPSPTNEMMHPEPTLEFAGALHCSQGAVSWDSGHSYASFNPGYEFDSYADVLCNPHEPPQDDEFGFPGDIMDGSGAPVTVKHEEWDVLSHHHYSGAC